MLLAFQLLSEFIHPIFGDVWLQLSSSPLTTRTLVPIWHFLDQFQLPGKFFDLLIFIKVVFFIINIFICVTLPRCTSMRIGSLSWFFTHLGCRSIIWISFLNIGVSSFWLIIIYWFLFLITWLLLLLTLISRIAHQAEIFMDKPERGRINAAITKLASEIIWIYSLLLIGIDLIRHDIALLLLYKCFGFGSHLLYLITLRWERICTRCFLAIFFRQLVFLFAFVFDIAHQLIGC